MDRTYTNLLAHLQSPSSTVQLPAVQATLTHYLALLTTPTPLIATAITSPLFQSPLSNTKLQALSTAVRHATHLKYTALKDEQRGLFSRGLRARLCEWGSAVLQGVYGGLAILRLACCTGLLLGLHGLDASVQSGGLKGQIEDEIIVAIAEVGDAYSSRGWEKEFQPATEHGEGTVLYISVVRI